jgi:hypothetical protein
LANGRKTGPKKRRTRRHMIADLAVNHVERCVLRCGYTLHRIVHDYGLDAAITTYSTNGEIENGVIWLQIKATDHVKRRKKDATANVRVQRKDLVYWSGELYPVILVLYDALADEAFWLHIQEELVGGRLFELARTGATVTMQIPESQRVGEPAIREFRRLKSQFLEVP